MATDRSTSTSKTKVGQGSELASGPERTIQLDAADLRTEIRRAYRQVEPTASYAGAITSGFGRSIVHLAEANVRIVVSTVFATVFSQLHNSLNGGSLGQGGMDELMPPAPPLDADTLLVPDPLLLNLDPPLDP